ncbi:ABC transporter permease [Burkholderia sp. MS389]|uniref:ABC transporter permease n=1 Tax=Burkholderia TaxID=32008 RepID=UPI000F5A112C|nr:MULTISPECIES: ABC transporter permease [unclassified Burkholderia]MBP0717847.1 ABC transporter permease [Burkholderia sp. AcTa6-5]QRR14997.1 ABC transporter permease [Burkholderia sp. MS389]RQV23123.1 ABC transporter permease [Burkholderia cenocepacia]RQV74468.1 ABC transporter permease [Burkholderia cenocepacia]
MFNSALIDLWQSLASWRLWMLLGWLEIRQRYARSRVGPFWLTISMGVMVGSLGVVYGTLFGQKMSDYLPFLATSIVMWGFFSQVVQEGSLSYINSGSYIRQTPTAKLIFVLQVVWRNLVVLTHNFVIILVLLVVFGVKDWVSLIFFVPAFGLYVLNAVWIAMVAGLLSARFRDLPQIIGAFLQVAFYVTPIIFKPTSLNRFSFIVEWNPLAYMIDIVRAPLIGEIPGATTWIVVGGMALVGWPLALMLTGRYLKRIPYWI